MQPINLLDYEELARQRMAHLPWAWDYFQGGSEDEVSLHANRTAFEHVRLRPRILVDVSMCDMRTSVLGTAVSMPILIAPTAGHGLAHSFPLWQTLSATAGLRLPAQASPLRERDRAASTRP